VVPSFLILLLVQIHLLLLWLPSNQAIQVVQVLQDLQQVQDYPGYLSFLVDLYYPLLQEYQAFQVGQGNLAYLVDQVDHVHPSYQLLLVLQVVQETQDLQDFRTLPVVQQILQFPEALFHLVCPRDPQDQVSQCFRVLLLTQLDLVILSFQANQLIQVVLCVLAFLLAHVFQVGHQVQSVQVHLEVLELQEFPWHLFLLENL
jgi:hypothetical protein